MKLTFFKNNSKRIYIFTIVSLLLISSLFTVYNRASGAINVVLKDGMISGAEYHLEPTTDFANNPYIYSDNWDIRVKNLSTGSFENKGKMLLLRPKDTAYSNKGRTFAHYETLYAWGAALGGNPHFVRDETMPTKITNDVTGQLVPNYYYIWPMAYKAGVQSIDVFDGYLEVTPTSFPTGSFETPSNITAGTEFNLSLSAQEYNPYGVALYFDVYVGGVKKYSGNAGSDSITGRNIPITINTSGQHTIEVKVKDKIERETVLTKTVTVAAPPVGTTPEPEPEPNPEPENLPPTVTINGPTTIMAGEYFCLSASASDSDGTIAGYSWDTSSVSGGSVSGASGCSLYYLVDKIGYQNVSVTVVDDKGATGSAIHQIRVVPPVPIASVTTSGASKENRKVELKSNTSSPSFYPIDSTKTHWEITPLDGQAVSNIKSQATLNAIDGEKYIVKEASTINALFKMKGNYKAKVYVENTAGYSATSERTFNIIEDKLPVADFSTVTTIYRENVWTLASPIYKATIKITDNSTSFDDIIGQRIYTYYYDSDNDGVFIDETPVVINDLNETYVEFQTDKVGKYLIEERVVEEFGQPTIDEFVTASDRKRDDTADKVMSQKVVEVKNLAPVASFEVGKKKTVDLQLAVGDTIHNDLSVLEGKINSIVKPQLNSENIDLNFSIVPPEPSIKIYEGALTRSPNVSISGYDTVLFRIEVISGKISLKGFYGDNDFEVYSFDTTQQVNEIETYTYRGEYYRKGQFDNYIDVELTFNKTTQAISNPVIKSYKGSDPLLSHDSPQSIRIIFRSLAFQSPMEHKAKLSIVDESTKVVPKANFTSEGTENFAAVLTDNVLSTKSNENILYSLSQSSTLIGLGTDSNKAELEGLATSSNSTFINNTNLDDALSNAAKYIINEVTARKTIDLQVAIGETSVSKEYFESKLNELLKPKLQEEKIKYKTSFSNIKVSSSTQWEYIGSFSANSNYIFDQSNYIYRIKQNYTIPGTIQYSGTSDVSYASSTDSGLVPQSVDGERSVYATNGYSLERIARGTWEDLGGFSANSSYTFDHSKYIYRIKQNYTSPGEFGYSGITFESYASTTLYDLVPEEATGLRTVYATNGYNLERMSRPVPLELTSSEHPTFAVILENNALTVEGQQALQSELEENNTELIALGKATNQHQFNQIISNVGSGTYIDNTVLDTAINEIATYIIEQIINNQYKVDLVFGVGDTVHTDKNLLESKVNNIVIPKLNQVGINISSLNFKDFTTNYQVGDMVKRLGSGSSPTSDSASMSIRRDNDSEYTIQIIAHYGSTMSVQYTYRDAYVEGDSIFEKDKLYAFQYDQDKIFYYTPSSLEIGGTSYHEITVIKDGQTATPGNVDVYSTKPADLTYMDTNNTMFASFIVDRALNVDEKLVLTKEGLIHNAHLIGLGTTNNQTDFTQIIQKNMEKGTYIDNNNMDTALNTLADYIIQEVTEKAELNEIYLTLDEIATYFTSYTDAEEDPKFAERWRYNQNPNVFEKNTGFANFNLTNLSSPITKFDRVGKYQTIHAARDNPVFTDERFDNYRLWSNEVDNWNIYAHRKPIADFNFTINGTTGAYTLTNTSYDLDKQSVDIGYGGGIKEIKWQWKEEGQATWTDGLPTNPLTRKVYKVKLKVWDFQNAEDEIEKVLNATGVNQSPIATFEPVPSDVYQNEIVQYTNQSYDPNGDTLTYEWSWKRESDTTWTNGTPTLSTDISREPTTKFSSKGGYLIRLRVKDSMGSYSDYVERRVDVLNRPPEAAFTYSPTTIYNNTSVSFSNTSTDPDTGETLTYKWEYMMPGSFTWTTFSAIQTPTSRVFGTIGEWKIRLTVSDGTDSGQTEKTIVVQNRRPTANFTYSPTTSIYRGTSITLTDSSTDSDGLTDIAWHLWETKLSTEATWETLGTTTNASFVPSKVGTYEIRKTVTDKSGLSHSVVKTVVVANRGPTVTISYIPTMDITDETPIQFTANGTDPDAEDLNHLTYQWSFKAPSSSLYVNGDINKYTQKILNEVGTWGIKVLVSDPYNATGSTTATIEVVRHNLPPKAGFNTDKLEYNVGDVVNVTSTASDPDNNPLTYKYVITTPSGSFTSETADFTFQATEEGLYTIEQTVTDSYGESDSIAKSVQVINLTIVGRVEHTEDWLAIHQQKGNHPLDFYSGEKFILKADVSQQPIDYVQVEFEGTRADGTILRMTKYLTQNTPSEYIGELYDPSMLEPSTRLVNGDVYFTFTVRYSNGYIPPPSIVTVRIIGTAYELLDINRTY